MTPERDRILDLEGGQVKKLDGHTVTISQTNSWGFVALAECGWTSEVIAPNRQTSGGLKSNQESAVERAKETHARHLRSVSSNAIPLFGV